MDAEVIVIGAGLSGLSAAKWLRKSGVHAVVLEAQDRVGGRTLTKLDPKVNYVDIGGAYVGPTQNHLLRMAKEYGVENYKVNEVQDLLHYKNGRRTRFSANCLPRRRNPFVNMDINNIMWLLDEMGKEIPADAPWSAPNAEKWDTMNFKQFLEENCWTKGAIEFFKSFININVTSESFEASLLSFAWYIKQCGGVKRIFSTTNGGQERKFKGGSQQISQRIADDLGSELVRLNSAVVAILQQNEHVIVKTLNGNDYKAKFVILACPPILQMKIHFSPPLPPLRNQMIQRAPMGTVMKVIMYYKTSFWTEKGFCGSMLIEGGIEHPVFFTVDDTKPDGSFPAIIGFVLADKCRQVVHLSPDERKVLIARSIAEATGYKEALDVIHYEEKNWMEEQYSGGCYTVIYPPGYITRYGKVVREPVGKLHFAGTETAIKWSGYMEGAISAGERAAREILHRMGKIGANQIWIEEPQSTDVIPRPFVDTFAEKYTPSVPGFLKMASLTTFVGVATLLFMNYERLLKK